jgi:hypothetical protein
MGKRQFCDTFPPSNQVYAIPDWNTKKQNDDEETGVPMKRKYAGYSPVPNPHPSSVDRPDSGNIPECSAKKKSSNLLGGWSTKKQRESI